MKQLIVFYDNECSFCQRCRAWASEQPSFIPIEFRPLRTDETRKQFPDLAPYEPEKELVVFTDEGAVYQGTNAWLLVLWALRRWRGWSLRLAQPAWRPLARRFWNWISAHRLDNLPGTMGNEAKTRRVFEQMPDPHCRLGKMRKEAAK